MRTVDKDSTATTATKDYASYFADTNSRDISLSCKDNDLSHYLCDVVLKVSNVQPAID